MKIIWFLLFLSLLIFINSQDEKKEDNSNNSNKGNENKIESNEENKNINEHEENEEQDIDIEIFPESEYIIDLNDNTINETIHNNSYVSCPLCKFEILTKMMLDYDGVIREDDKNGEAVVSEQTGSGESNS